MHVFKNIYIASREEKIEDTRKSRAPDKPKVWADTSNATHFPLETREKKKN